jgi:prevent-host-death family protein
MSSSPLSTSATIGLFEAKTHFSELIGRVEAGEEVTITRHGAAVAKLVPVRRESTPEERRAAWEAWDKRAAGISLGGLRIKDLIEEGRR